MAYSNDILDSGIHPTGTTSFTQSTFQSTTPLNKTTPDWYQTAVSGRRSIIESIDWEEDDTLPEYPDGPQVNTTPIGDGTLIMFFYVFGGIIITILHHKKRQNLQNQLKI